MSQIILFDSGYINIFLYLYRHLKHELRTLQTICPENDYGNICPACPVVILIVN